MLCFPNTANKYNIHQYQTTTECTSSNKVCKHENSPRDIKAKVQQACLYKKCDSAIKWRVMPTSLAQIEQKTKKIRYISLIFSKTIRDRVFLFFASYVSLKAWDMYKIGNSKLYFKYRFFTKNKKYWNFDAKIDEKSLCLIDFSQNYRSY